MKKHHYHLNYILVIFSYIELTIDYFLSSFFIVALKNIDGWNFILTSSSFPKQDDSVFLDDYIYFFHRIDDKKLV